jgi:DNA-binding NarL/FixJ family response regulator
MRKLWLTRESELVAFFGAAADGMSGRCLVRGPRRCLILRYAAPQWNLPPCLSRAEREITDALIAGHPQAVMAHDRGVSPRTIAKQVGSIYRKLKVYSRLELMVALRSRFA